MKLFSTHRLFSWGLLLLPSLLGLAGLCAGECETVLTNAEIAANRARAIEFLFTKHLKVVPEHFPEVNSGTHSGTHSLLKLS